MHHPAKMMFSLDSSMATPTLLINNKLNQVIYYKKSYLEGSRIPLLLKLMRNLDWDYSDVSYLDPAMLDVKKHYVKELERLNLRVIVFDLDN